MPRITGQGRIVIITVSIHISSELPIFLLPNLVLLYIIIDRSKYFGYGQLRPLRPACTHSQNRREREYAARIGPTFHICFSSVFPKKAWIILRKTDPHPIWMAWSGFGQTHLVWKQAGVQESPGPVSGRTQPARYQFHIFRLGSVLPQTSRIIL